MKVSFLLLLLLSWGPFLFATAQPANPAVPASISSQIEQVVPAVDAPLAVTTIQRGVLLSPPLSLELLARSSNLGNGAQIMQFGDRNVTLLQQYGQRNVASVRIKGSQNIVNALQGGNRNVLDVTVLGNNNRLPIIQRSDSNALLLEVENVNGLRFPTGTAIEQTSRGLGIPLRLTITPGQRGN